MRRMYFDLETVPDMGAVAAHLEANPFDPAEVKLGNLKDKAKIEAKLAAAEESHRDDLVDRSALNPGLCNILTIQWAAEDGEVLVACDLPEADLIRTFFAAAGRFTHWHNWTGSNTGGNFDLKMLYRRGWALGVEMPPAFDSEERTHDVARELLRFDDYRTFLSLENAARQLGIAVEEVPVKGRDFWRWWQGKAVESALSAEEQRELAMQYAVQDVELLAEIHGRVSPSYQKEGAV